MTLGERIQQLRKTEGLSQEQLADVLDVSRQAVSKWETDQSAPEIEKILAMSKHFGISTDELTRKGTNWWTVEGIELALKIVDFFSINDIIALIVEPARKVTGWWPAHKG